MTRLIIILGLIASLVGWGEYRHLAGRNSMKRDIALVSAQARLETIEEVERVKDEVDSLTDDEFLDQLSDWVRETPGGG